MESLVESCTEILDQLDWAVGEVASTDFSRPSEALGGSTIGQHVRHTMEFFFCLQACLTTGIVNYDKRAHDRRLETDKLLTLQAIRGVRNTLTHGMVDRPLRLHVNYHQVAGDSCEIHTTLSRELAYNIEHAIHHMAIIKIGMRDVAPYVEFPPYFGVAASTIRHEATKVKSEI